MIETQLKLIPQNLWELSTELKYGSMNIRIITWDYKLVLRINIADNGFVI